MNGANPSVGVDAGKAVSINRLLAEMRPTAWAYAMLGLCVMVGMVEGYDAQAMAFAAPLVARAWALSSGTIGLLLATSIVGMVAGSFLLTPLGDRWGRRPSIVLALLITAPATAFGAIAPDFGSLVAARFVAGLGLGLAFPNVIALAMELMPARLRTLAVVLVGCGYPFGGALGGILAARLIPANGYPAVFLVGGAATLVALLLCAAFLPESPAFLARRQAKAGHLPRLLARLGARVPAGTESFFLEEAPRTRSSVAALFEPERRYATMVLWLINFANLLMVYYFVTWLPTVLVRNGASPALAAGALALLSASGMVGGLGLAFALPRLGAIRTLGGAYLVAAAGAAALSTFVRFDGSFLVVLAIAGAALVGSQFCLTAVVNHFYPSAIRATASGYVTGVGRLGAVAAPLAGAAVMSLDGTARVAFAVAMVPALLAFAGVLLLRRADASASEAGVPAAA